MFTADSLDKNVTVVAFVSSNVFKYDLNNMYSHISAVNLLKFKVITTNLNDGQNY